jgi:hypothetical protein
MANALHGGAIVDEGIEFLGPDRLIDVVIEKPDVLG